MDEVLFRSSQKLETIQMQAELVASKTKDLIHGYSQQSRALLLQVWNSDKIEQLRYNLIQLVSYLIEISKDFKERAIDVADPKRLWMYLSGLLGGKWTRREVSLACAGFVVGGLVGVAVGLAIRRKEPILRYMEAVQISHYLGPEAAAVVEDAIAPHECGDYDVLVNVKAASVQIVDAQICCGYGRNFRKILRRIYEQSAELPVVLGRDCTGVITDLGKKVKRLEIGDEVWVTVPFWSQGTLSQSVIMSENRVARKPKNVGFEGACSIPYAGSIALSVLTEANIDFTGAQDKRFLIQGGCTPVGCILIQLLRSWNAHITTTCYKRAVPVAKALGASEIIGIEDPCNLGNDKSSGDHLEEPLICKSFLKELELRGEIFDTIILTRNEKLDWEKLSEFCTKNGHILSTVPEELMSDSCGLFSRLILTGYVKLKILLQNTLSWPSNDYDEAHLCHTTLDKLTELVEEGVLQTVVDKVFHPKDIEVALNHIQSPQSIGSTVITFR